MKRNLQSIYLEGMAVRITDLEDVLARLESEPEEAVPALMRIAHSLKGSGATYGFPEVSAVAAKLEEAAEEARPAAARALLRVLRDLQEGNREAGTSKRVLLVTGDATRGQEVADRLAPQGAEVVLCPRAAEASAALARGTTDLVALDLVLPDRDGRLLLAELRARKDLSGVPLLVVSGVRDDAVRNECLALGATACLEQPRDAGVLAEAITEQLETHRRATPESHGYDRLTGLMGRRAFSEVFDRMVALCRRQELPGVVALIDVDHLARTNHEAGTAAGDALLLRLARLLQQRLRRCDVPVRWGGEEFAVLFPAVDERAAQRALSRIAEEFGKEPPHPGSADRASFSAGVAALRVDDDAAEAVARADWFLFYAKAEGRNRVLCASDKLAARPARSVLLVEDDPEMAQLVRSLLEEQDIQVIHREDGEAGLAAFLKGGFDLAIVDIKMPKMDGLELLGRIRASTTDPELPVILLTAEGSEADVVRGFARGADDYVVKPFRGEELMARVRRRLPRESRRAP